MIEIFTKEQFETALPDSKNYPVKYEGIRDGEHCYSVTIDKNSKVFVRSSVKISGVSAGTGEDSIRTYILDSNDQPLGSKVTKWTTREPGWNKRMLENIRFLIRLRNKAGNDEKGNPLPILKVKAETPNKGRYFTKNGNNFIWLTDSKKNLL